jgi:hypothetical protein
VLAPIPKSKTNSCKQLEEIEAGFAGAAKLGETNLQLPALSNLTQLYVGGRQAQLGHLREFARRSGAALLHHDGGIDERGGILQGLISRADVVLFPVDCVSHTAMLLAKRLCRQYGKPILPLRSTGLASFCAALKQIAVPISSSCPEQGCGEAGCAG